LIKTFYQTDYPIFEIHFFVKFIALRLETVLACWVIAIK